MRRFLENHSSLYRWAVAPAVEDSRRWRATAVETAAAFADARIRHAREIDFERQLHASTRAHLEAQHAETVAKHDAANHRLRQTNRDLVGALRQRGIAAEEHPASKCLSCGSLAAVPEDGRHQMGVVRYPDRTVRLYCDGSEE